MASPVAHSLAGIIVYFTAHRRPTAVSRDLLWLILAANIADFDLIPSVLMGDHSLYHRTLSHSITGALLFAAIVYAVCRWREHSRPWRMTLLMFTAYLSQLVVDWLSFDTGPPAGIPLFWPFSHEHYIADPTVFLNIERDDMLSAPIILHNVKAVLLEIIVLGPPAALLWWWTGARK